MIEYPTPTCAGWYWWQRTPGNEPEIVRVSLGLMTDRKRFLRVGTTFATDIHTGRFLSARLPDCGDPPTGTFVLLVQEEEEP